MPKLKVKVEPTDNCGEWRVIEYFVFMGVVVNVGQLTDGASVPWMLRWLIKVGGRLFTPSVIHDTGYRLGLFTKRKMDSIYYKAMVINGVPKWKRYLIYVGVVLFGHFSYRGKMYNKIKAIIYFKKKGEI